MANTSKLGLPLLANGAANQTLANTTFALINQLLMAGVVDKDLSTPPSSPANESLYIVASGNWGTASSKAGQLAFWLTDVGAWTLIVPRAGWEVRVLDELDGSGLPLIYAYTGSAWVQQPSSGGGGSANQAIIVACSDETTALTAGTNKVTFRMPYGMTGVTVKASLTVAQSSGSLLTVDVNEAGTSILSTKLTFDNTEKTTVTAATPPVVSDSTLAADAEITVDIDQIGDGTAKGLKVTLIGTPA